MIETISVPGPKGRTHEAALAFPDEGEAPWPGVVVIHDITGLGADARRHCQRFAEAGYAAIAPDLYAGGRVSCVVKALTGSMTGRGESFEVIDTARQILGDRAEVDAARIAVVGFCMGGSFALAAAADQTFAVAAPFYGAVPKDASRLQGICPTIAQFGGQDVVFRSHAKRLARHLEDLGVDHEVIIYEDAGHSFMNQLTGVSAKLARYSPIRAYYDPETEAKAWNKLLDFFEHHMASSA